MNEPKFKRGDIVTHKVGGGMPMHVDGFTRFGEQSQVNAYLVTWFNSKGDYHQLELGEDELVEVK